jgi:hypothetical protein
LRRAQHLSLALVLAAAPACGLFPSFDGFGGGDADAGDAAATDSGANDAVVLDGTTDGTTDGAADADATSPTDGNDGASGAVPCAQARTLPGVLFCEDFETGTIDASRWTRQKNTGGATSADGTRVHRGAYALRSHVDAVVGNPTNAEATISNDVLPLPSTFFVRVFVYAASPATTGNENFVALVADDAPAYDSVDLILRNGVLGEDDTIGTGLSASAFPLDRWVCVEWKVTSGSPGEMRTWIDGGEIAALHGTPNVPLPKTLVLGIGIFPAPVGPAHDLWADDLLVSTQQIGCEE